MSERKRRPPLRVERVLPAPPEAVFRAWTDPESLRRWMLPGDIRRAEVRCDPRVGGRFEIVMHGDENAFRQHGVYRVVDPPRRLVFTWFGESLPETRTLVTVEIEPGDPGTTRLTLIHEDLPEGPEYEGHANGWADILRHLGESLAPAARRTP